MTPPATVSRYLCGTCGDESVAAWPTHQAHYEEHRDGLERTP